jgi:hypothetical protein
MMVITPQMIQMNSNNPGDWTALAISAETIKIPPPIMDPIISMVASSRLNPLMKSTAATLLINTLAFLSR